MRRYVLTLTFVFLGCSALLSSVAAADGSGSLAGTVMTPSGRGLVGAVIALFRQDDSGVIVSLTESDQRGTYSLNDIAPGSYSLRVSKYGYQVLNSPHVTIDSGKTTTVNLVLQQLLDLISESRDPRNWDLRTVMRSTSDRRLIFRDLPGISTTDEERARAFDRSGTIDIVSGDLLSGNSYAQYPYRGDTGVASNFAFVEPVTQRGRMILSGQLTSGSDSLWTVRNTFDYRSDPNRDWRFSVGYGRLDLCGLSMGSLAGPVGFFDGDSSLGDFGVETLAAGFQARSQFSNTVAVEYGLDLSRINYGTVKSVWSPYLQLAVSPHRGWLLRTMVTSRRVSDNNSVELPDGERINLLEPVYISDINNQISVSRVRHSELSAARKLGEDTTLEVAVYRDRTDGPGTPFLMTTRTKDGESSTAVQLRADQDARQGLRVGFSRVLMNSIRGSVTYDYGTAAGLSSLDHLVPSDVVAAHLLDFVRRSYYHSISSQLEATVPQTQTHVQATLRWYPRNPISPVDLFADQMDAGSKGVTFSVRQTLPMPEFLGCSRRWEARIDVRNPFDQGIDHIPTTDGEILLTRNPRVVRFGLNFNFF
jgi:hypothetical protein